MKGRLFVVDDKTLIESIKTSTASVKVPEPFNLENEERQQWGKTVIDIIADMLQIQIGDYIFFWEITNKGGKSRIHGIYRAISSPYYSPCGDGMPFKIKIERAYDFINSIKEYDLLNDPYIKIDLWTIIGKKISGKSRGSTPLSPLEMNCLITKLVAENEDYIYHQPNGIIKKVKNKLRVSLSASKPMEIPKKLKNFKIEDLSYVKEINNNKVFTYEKCLEALFNDDITNGAGEIIRQIGIEIEKVIWHSNYLTYSIDREEIDYLIIESEDGFAKSRMCLLEFSIGSIDEMHICKCIRYAKWVDNNIGEGSKITRPICIFKKTNPSSKTKFKLKEIIEREEKDKRTLPIELYSYEIVNQKLKLNKFTLK